MEVIFFLLYSCCKIYSQDFAFDSISAPLLRPLAEAAASGEKNFYVGREKVFHPDVDFKVG